MKNVTCPEPEKLVAYKQGVLPREEAAKVQKHLRRCDACRADASRIGPARKVPT